MLAYAAIKSNIQTWTPVSRIALVSPARSRQIESILLRMAQSGQLKSRVTEEQLIGLLEQVSILCVILKVF